MNVRELFKGIFCLVIRLIGVAFLYQALEAVPIIFATVYAVPWSLGHKDLITRLLMMAWQLAVAYWLVRGAPQLVRLAYPEADSQPGAAPRP
jgi:hypothetical protein